MQSLSLHKLPRWVKIFTLLSGALVAAGLAPHHLKWFAPNFLYYWAPHVAVLLVLCVLRASYPLIAAAAIALSTYLALFGAWVFSASHPDSMAWVGYLLNFPGALAGAVVGRILEWRKSLVSTALPFGVGCTFVAMGLALNQTVVCMTVMACRIG